MQTEQDSAIHLKAAQFQLYGNTERGGGAKAWVLRWECDLTRTSCIYTRLLCLEKKSRDRISNVFPPCHLPCLPPCFHVVPPVYDVYSTVVLSGRIFFLLLFLVISLHHSLC
jgi:hypothetical protein